MRLRHALPFCILALSLAVGLPAEAQRADTSAASASDESRFFTRREAMELGAATLATVILSTFDLRIRNAVQTERGDSSRVVIETVSLSNRINETTLTLGTLALWGIGRATKQHTLADVAFHTAEGVFIASVASQLVRGPLGRARPHVSPDDQYDFHWFQGFGNFHYRAFPSIHTSSAFAAAAVLANESRRRWPGDHRWIAPVAYTLAATPGLARIYLDQHWSSDILMGAVVGIIAGRQVVRYNHERKPGNRVDRFFLGEGAGARQLIGVELRF